MNKFQALLYGQARARGYVVERIARIEELDEIFWPGEIVFHAHWFAGLLSGAEDEGQYRANIDDAFTKLDELHAGTGARLVWTAHNFVPHGSPYPDADHELRRRVIGNFDLVHVMDGSHLALLEERFGTAPRRSVVAPHPHYRGAYADHLERDEARELLGFDPDTTILLFFGSLRPYKGIEELIAAFRSARKARPELRLAIAGIPSDEGYASMLDDVIGDDVAIRYLPAKIPDEDIQIFFRAADAAVLPYAQDQLNSGAVLLALSFGCPVIASDEPAFAAFKPLGVSLYPRKDIEALERKLRDFDPAGLRVDDAGLGRAHDPRAVSDALFDAMDSLFS